jgi:O-antigen/teichoic acid export membrane protein
VIIGIGKLADMLFGPSSEIIVLSKYYWFNIILISFLAVTVIIANNILIPIYGINGAAIGAAFALISFNAIKYVFILVTLKMQPFQVDSIKVLAIAGLVLAIHFILPRVNNPFLDIIYRSGVITVVYAGLIFVLKASPDGNAFLKKVIKRFF